MASKTLNGLQMPDEWRATFFFFFFENELKKENNPRVFFCLLPMTMTQYLCPLHRQDICRARDKCDTLGKLGF